MSRICQRCGGACCRYFCFQIDEPDDFEEFDDVRWYLLHEDVTVHIEDGDWYISIQNKCNVLGPDNRCMDYENRPVICRKYDPENCDFTGGDYGYDNLFETPEQIEAYARKKLGEEAYEKAKAKALAKLERPRKKKRAKVASLRADRRPVTRP